MTMTMLRETPAVERWALYHEATRNGRHLVTLTLNGRYEDRIDVFEMTEHTALVFRVEASPQGTSRIEVTEYADREVGVANLAALAAALNTFAWGQLLQGTSWEVR